MGKAMAETFGRDLLLCAGYAEAFTTAPAVHIKQTYHLHNVIAVGDRTRGLCARSTGSQTCARPPTDALWLRLQLLKRGGVKKNTFVSRKCAP